MKEGPPTWSELAVSGAVLVIGMAVVIVVGRIAIAIFANN